MAQVVGLGKSGSNYGGALMYIDASEIIALHSKLSANLTPEKARRLLMWTYREVGRKVKRTLRKDIPIDYAVKGLWVSRGVGGARTAPLGCVIPLSGARGTIGRKGKGTFGIEGTVVRGSRIHARIAQKKQSTLPKTMAHQGGNAPFLATGGAPNGLVMTRTKKTRLPIARVVGVGMPQMPVNQSLERVEEDLLTEMRNELLRLYPMMLSGEL